MATDKKLTELIEIQTPIEATDLMYIVRPSLGASGSKFVPVANLPGNGGEWGTITGTLSNQTDLQNALNAKANTASLGALAFLSSINDGNWSGTALSISNGGTNATTAAGARTSLGLVIGTDVLAPNGSAASLTNFPTFNQNTTGTASNVTGVVAIANGGTNATTAANARSNLGLGSAAVLTAGVANGVATLDGSGKLSSAQIPDISIVQYLGTVNSENAMLALTGQQGDWCTRTDLGTNWIITGNDPSLIGNWTQLSYPTAPVTSVFGRTGGVIAVSTDYSSVGITNTAIGATNPSTGAFTSLSLRNATASGQSLTGSADTSIIDLSTTWNTTGTPTAIKLNITDTASDANSRLIDLQVGGSSKFNIGKDGTITTAANSIRLNGSNSIGIGFFYGGSYSSGYAFNNNQHRFLSIYSDGPFSSGSFLSLSPGLMSMSGQVSINGGTQKIDYPSLNIVQTWNSAVTVTGASGNGTTATLTFAQMAQANNWAFPVGSTIVVTGVNPSGYNGTFTVTASNTTSVSYANTTTGAWVSGGSITQIITAIKANITDTASGSGSLLMDLQVGGTSKFAISKTGNININSSGGQLLDFQSAGTGIGAANTGDLYLNTQGTTWIRMGGWGILSFISPIHIGGPNHDPYLAIYGTDYGVAEQRNPKVSTRPQIYRIYNTYTSSTDYERLGLNWTANVAQIYTEKGSAGGTSRDLVLGTNATTAISINGTSQNVTVSNNLTVNGSITTGTSLGVSYTSLTDAGGGVAYKDTVSTSGCAVYEVIISGNPDAATSVSLLDFVYGKIIIGTGWNGSAAIDYVSYVQENPDPRSLYNSSGSNLSVTIKLVSSGTEYDSLPQGTSYTLRVKISGYNSSYSGNNTTIRLKRIM